MASTITVRNVDDSTKRRLQHRAVDNGRSLEAEVRAILTEAANTARGAESTSTLFAAAAQFRREVQDLDFTWAERIDEPPREVFS